MCQNFCEQHFRQKLNALCHTVTCVIETDSPAYVWFLHISSSLFYPSEKTVFYGRSGVNCHWHCNQVKKSHRLKHRHTSFYHIRDRSSVTTIRFMKIPWAKVFHFSSSNLAMIPPSSMLRCSSLVPARIIMRAEPQSENIFFQAKEI